jgi:tetratricopeptide (TPR) repeat protein/CHAT domain-containing protein
VIVHRVSHPKRDSIIGFAAVLSALLGLAGPAGAQDPAPELSPAERQKLEAQAKQCGERTERYYQEGRLTEALEEAELHLRIERRLYPTSKYPDGHPDLATALNNLGLVAKAMDRYEIALDHHQQALAIDRRLYPESKYPAGHHELATDLNNLGALLEAMGRYEPALDYFRQAVAMGRRLYPPSKYPDGHTQLASSLSSLGTLLEAMGQDEPALDHFREALAMWQRLYPESRYPEGRTELAHGHNNLGFVLEGMGRYEPALDHYRQALAMGQRLFPPSKYPDGHDDLATYHNNLGALLKTMGRYEPALDRYRQALAMRRRLYPPSMYPDGHTQLASSLNNLGALLEAMGRYEPALDHYRHALAMRRRLFPESRYPKGHPRLATSHINLGALLKAMGRYEPALDHLQQALAMDQRLYPPSQYPAGHPDLAGDHINLGALLREMKRYEPALDHLQQSLAMRQRLYPQSRYPDGHLDLADSLSGLGAVLWAMGRYEPALDHDRQALAMRRRLYPSSRYPDGHPDLAWDHDHLGIHLMAMGRPEPALDHFEQAVAMSLGSARMLGDLATESEALAFRRQQPQALDRLLSASWGVPEPARTDRAWPRVWMSRSAIARTIEARHDSLASADLPPAARDRMEALVGIRRRLARRLLQPLPIDPDALARRDREVAALTEDKDRIERELARQVPALAERKERDRIGPGDLAGVLPPRSAYLELLRYNRFRFDSAKPGDVGVTRAPHYVAFVVPAGGPAHRVELGPAAAIEEALADWRHAIDQRRDSPAAGVLRRLVWAPFAGLIGPDVQTVYLVPDGALARLPWAALPGSRADTVLLEEFAIAIVPHGPFLVQHLREAGEGSASTARVELLAVGGVNYDGAPSPSDKPADLLALHRGPDRDGAAASWPYLQGTERELQLIGDLVGPGTRVVRGAEAGTVRLLGELPRARLAHLATHGFFNEKAFRDEQRRAEEAIRSWQFSMEGPSGLGGAGAGAASPLSYTGLVLAGANRPEAAGPDGGILTGEMILGLDLHRMDLAVLSACQTGLGAVADGECVQNLQRAFHVAGCGNVIASLWSVPDESTAALMAVFYEERLRHHRPPLEALRSAQLWVYRHPGRLAELAERGAPRPDKARRLPGAASAPVAEGELEGARSGRRASVKDWGGFILSGPGR